MKLDNFLQIFVVKEKRFFPLFISAAENILEAARLLQKQTETSVHEERWSLAHQIKEYETIGDKITDKIIDELLDAYVTPFEREDIHNLAESLDTFLDCIRDSSKKIAIYQPKEANENMVEIAKYLVKDAEIVLEITHHFENLRKELKVVDDLCDEIKEDEHRVDEIYESYMIKLFEVEEDGKELVKKRSIIQTLEDTSDVAKKLSNTIRSIVVKMG